MVEWFQMGGFWMYPLVFLAFLLLPFGFVLVVLAAVTPPGVRRWVGWLAILGLAGAALPAFVGLAGFLAGVANVNAALAMVDPAVVDELRRVGMEEARIPLSFGLGVAGLVAADMAVALALAWRPATRAPSS
ncbi:MAG: hypothetical protein H0V89_07025 [Deltaproteobacteria bacterium]|nr:hypothetical protein [Deltaproteobacteria bacterium]